MLVQIMFLLCYCDLEQLCRYRTKFDFGIELLSESPVGAHGRVRVVAVEFARTRIG